jgi:hypothetical protein
LRSGKELVSVEVDAAAEGSLEPVRPLSRGIPAKGPADGVGIGIVRPERRNARPSLVAENFAVDFRTPRASAVSSCASSSTQASGSVALSVHNGVASVCAR